MIKAPKLDHPPRQMGAVASWDSKDRAVSGIKKKQVVVVARTLPASAGGLCLGEKPGSGAHPGVSPRAVKGQRQPLGRALSEPAELEAPFALGADGGALWSSSIACSRTGSES